MVWYPACFEDDRPGAAMFDKGELLAEENQDGVERFVSADVQEEVSQPVIDARIAWQTRDSLRETHGREEALFVQFICGEIREISEHESETFKPMKIERDHVAANPETGIPENPAHCAIRNTSTKPRTMGKGGKRIYADYLRTQLLRLIRNTFTYGQVFPDLPD
jgi:hypothetical protein